MTDPYGQRPEPQSPDYQPSAPDASYGQPPQAAPYGQQSPNYQQSAPDPYAQPAPQQSAPDPYGNQPYGGAAYGQQSPPPAPYGQGYGQQPAYGYGAAEHPQASTVQILGIVGIFVGICAFIAWYMGGQAKKEIGREPLPVGRQAELGYAGARSSRSSTSSCSCSTSCSLSSSSASWPGRPTDSPRTKGAGRPSGRPPMHSISAGVFALVDDHVGPGA